jgi:plasmid maintenance system antidote protein VapI
MVEAAKRLRLSHAQVSFLISGARGVSLDSALRIQEVAGIPVEAWSGEGSADHDQG